MANSCINCGTKIYHGICSNCEEENYIFQNQILADDMNISISDEFAQKVESQKGVQKSRLKGMKP